MWDNDLQLQIFGVNSNFWPSVGQGMGIISRTINKMRKLCCEELKFSCQVVNEESTPVNLKGTAEGKIFWEKRFFTFWFF